MADKEKKAHLPWGMDMEGLQPNSVKTISQTKLKAFSLGRTNPVKKTSPFIKKKQETEKKRRIDAKEAAQVFEQFVASFEGPGKTGKTFVRGSTINPESSSSSTSDSTSVPGSVYKPVSKFQVEKEEKPPAPTVTRPTAKKPPVKKGTEKKKSILELFREELKRSQEERKERHAKKESGRLPLDAPETSGTSAEIFKVEEYKDLVKGSFDMGDPLTTNLYVGNINPKMNEEMLCQMFGKYGPLASVKVMWPRTEEEKARNRNCGFVAFMKRKDAEKALEAFKGTTIMEYEVQVGWGKAVPLPPHPIYVPPNVKEEENAKIPDPPSGLPFNAQPRKKGGGGGGGIMGEGGRYGNVPPPGGGGVGEEKVEKEENFEDVLYSAVVRVVIPTDQELLRLIHRMIEFVIREGPMFEAMIMNKEINNPLFQFLFDNQSPAHIYYRWKLFSILQGDSPETWRTEEFRMFEAGSLWKPPPLKNLRAKVMPPVDEVVRRGQLSSKNRDDLEDQLRGISMERSKIKESMIWCLDHADSAEEIVECVTESLCIEETLLPMKLARLYLVNDILQNCSAKVPNASNFRRGFESKLLPIMEHFHTVLKGIPSRMRAEQFKRRVLVCLRAWSQLSVYHFNLVDKLRETFIGKTQEELEKQRAFETVAALISIDPSETGGGGGGGGGREEEEMISLLDNRPIDFSRGMNIDGVPLEENIDGEPLPDPDLDGIPLSKTEDIDGVPMEEEKDTAAAAQGPLGVRSKWELVDYGDDSDDEEPSAASPTATTGSSVLSKKEQQQLLAELDEKKRKMLREVELKVVELSDALEASGSYSKEEILERVSKFRDKLMQEAVEPKRSPQPSRKGKGDRSRSPSPSTLAKYNLENSPKSSSKKCSPPHSPERTKWHSPSSSPSRQKRSPSPSSRKRHHTPSPSRGRRSRSPETKKRRKHSSSPSRRRSHSRSPRRRSRSRSPTSRNTSHSHSPKRRSRSPRKQRSKSRSPRRRSRSRSPPRKRSRSRSPRHSSSSKRRSRSRSPKSRRHRSRSRSPRSSKKSKRRSRSPSPHKSSRSSSSKKSKH